MPKFLNIFKLRKTWSDRATCVHDNSELKEFDVWKHSRWLFWGFIIQLLSFSGFVGGTIAIAMLYFMPSQYPDDDLYAPGYWEVALPVWGTVVGLSLIPFIVSVIINRRGKTIVKRDLLPARCHVCAKCFYDLSARPRDKDICPECGMNAPRRECVRLWCKLLRSRF